MRRLFSRRNTKDKDVRDPKRTVAVAVLDDSLPPTPVLSSAGSEPASSASSNGSASLSIPTPDDPHTLARTPTKSKSWTSWLGKKSGTIKRGRPADPRGPSVDQLWVESGPDWRPTQPPPILHAPPVPAPKSQPPVLTVDIDSDEDASSSGSDDDDSVSLLPPALSPPITPTSVAQSRKNLEILIQNSLVPPLVPSPFSHLPGAPVYPRSSNPPRSLSARPSIQSAMHKTLLLRRLHHTDASSLTAAQELSRSISPFASRPPPIPVAPPSSLPWFNDRALTAEMRLSPSSPGLRRWMSRPCFEERFTVWVPLNGVITAQPVQGSSLAVAELEYSAALDAMIGFGLPPVEEDPSPVPPPPVPTPQPQPAAAPAVVRNTSYQAVPSPLRNSALKSPTSKSPVSAPVPDVPALPPAVTAPTAASRVRFVEEDKEDAIPLGYALRVKKRREEKAKFLREEQEKRAFETERAKQEAEKLKREQERKQWEEERKAWEKEKRAMEEERKQRIYAEEVAAARLRREHQRAGGSYGAGASNTGLLAASSSAASLRDERNKHTRPLHDQGGPRRQASEPAVPQHGNSPSSSPHTSSPGSSRPPSVAGHHTGSMGRNSSRPPSIHTSSEDGRQPSNSNSANRSSMASLPGRSAFDRSSTYSMWSASNPTLMPPVPAMPMYAMDMPLLPPTPPFMLQQYPRPRSQNSQNASPGRSSPSASPSRQRLPSNNSSERVNVQQSGQSSSSRRGSNSSSHRPDMTHQRRSSDDARRASLPPPKPSQTYGSMRSQSSTTLSRGRPPIPLASQPHPPSPWTAPPLTTSYSQQQLSAPAIISGYSMRPPPPSTRRQTTIS
ncbi:hypothetical protein B0H16DRAFT_1877924 [Mycena metata]|uniref:Uncharacterized protein n=1 Tax=Mycena metata TaxID=1033252 RepID=A0AAD7KBH5_9AGAR|nr:hypothetical protein B0H16DRAFT_1877924 [Mycena metata]